MHQLASYPGNWQLAPLVAGESPSQHCNIRRRSTEVDNMAASNNQLSSLAGFDTGMKVSKRNCSGRSTAGTLTSAVFSDCTW